MSDSDMRERAARVCEECRVLILSEENASFADVAREAGRELARQIRALPAQDAQWPVAWISQSDLDILGRYSGQCQVVLHKHGGARKVALYIQPLPPPPAGKAP